MPPLFYESDRRTLLAALRRRQRRLRRRTAELGVSLALLRKG